jgi:hypothetical protein
MFAGLPRLSFALCLARVVADSPMACHQIRDRSSRPSTTPILDFSSLQHHTEVTASAARSLGTAPRGASAKRREALEKGAMRPLFHVLTAAVASRS